MDTLILERAGDAAQSGGVDALPPNTECERRPTLPASRVMCAVREAQGAAVTGPIPRVAEDQTMVSHPAQELQTFREHE